MVQDWIDEIDDESKKTFVPGKIFVQDYNSS